MNEDGTIDEGSPTEAPESNQAIYAEIVELEGYLYHLNDMYGRALSVSGPGDGPALARNLLERAQGHLERLRELLGAVNFRKIPDEKLAAWVLAQGEIARAISLWLAGCELSLATGRPDDDFGIEARTIVLEAQWKLEYLLNPKT